MNRPSLTSLVVITAINYLAQIPYYFHQYYLPHHSPPNWLGVGLLTATLIWFVIGIYLYRTNRRSGYWLLLSYLAAVGLFYIHALLFSFVGQGALAQLSNPSWFLKIIFAIGYLHGIVAVYYFYTLLITEINAASPQTSD